MRERILDEGLLEEVELVIDVLRDEKRGAYADAIKKLVERAEGWAVMHSDKHRHVLELIESNNALLARVSAARTEADAWRAALLSLASVSGKVAEEYGKLLKEVTI